MWYGATEALESIRQPLFLKLQECDRPACNLLVRLRNPVTLYCSRLIITNPTTLHHHSNYNNSSCCGGGEGNRVATRANTQHTVPTTVHCKLHYLHGHSQTSTFVLFPRLFDDELVSLHRQTDRIKSLIYRGNVENKRFNSLQNICFK